MCGIAGIVSNEGEPIFVEELHRMCDAMIHRGPDEEGYYLDPRAGLGMRRLSIIDLETGRQPIPNEDGSVWAILNGEIYNFQELRSGLERRGHEFRTATDTETIVHLYEEFGPRCADRLRGMFAFAVWDARRRRLLLARDRLGIKPLYYTQAGGRLVFASELKAVLQANGVARELNWRAFRHLLAFLTTPLSESIVAGVRKLEPGHLLTASPDGGVRVERYWELAFEPEIGRSEEYFVERLREMLEDSVRAHLVSDVPLGAFLSGGIDSSSVVAAMARLSPAPVKTFSVGFADEDYDELRDARLVAARYGTDHHEVVLEPDVTAVLEDLIRHLDEPFGDSSAIPTYVVSQLASRHVKVVLSGDGGDELFAGYDKYLVERRERGRRPLPSGARRVLGLIGKTMPNGLRGRNFLRHLALTGPDRYLDAVTLFRPDDQERLLRAEAFEHLLRYDPWAEAARFLEEADGHWLSKLQHLDLKSYLPLDILTKVDRMSMAHSLEVRVPLLDHRLVEFAATIPPELHLTRGSGKSLFKRALRGVLPDAILDKPKHGFAVPLGRWFRGRLASFVEEVLMSETTRRRGIFDPAAIRRLVGLHEKGRELDLQLWTLISFELWCRAFLDGRAETTASNDLHPPSTAGPPAPQEARAGTA